jgi:hypothetical protein
MLEGVGPLSTTRVVPTRWTVRDSSSVVKGAFSSFLRFSAVVMTSTSAKALRAASEKSWPLPNRENLESETQLEDFEQGRRFRRDHHVFNDVLRVSFADNEV